MSKMKAGLSKIRNAIEKNVSTIVEKAYDKLGSKFSQKDIDELHRKLQTPVDGLENKIEKAANKFPLIKRIGTSQIVWILKQGSNVLHLGVSLLNSPEVSSKSKTKLTLALAYFISPIDLAPALLLGPVGYLDDVMFLVWAVDSILNGQNEEEKALIKKIWKGDINDLEKLRSYLKYVDVLKLVQSAVRKPTK